MITKGELRSVLKQFLPTSTVRNALGQIRRICMLILGNKELTWQLAPMVYLVGIRAISLSFSPSSLSFSPSSPLWSQLTSHSTSFQDVFSK